MLHHGLYAFFANSQTEHSHFLASPTGGLFNFLEPIADATGTPSVKSLPLFHYHSSVV
jgi:hypothetical protein